MSDPDPADPVVVVPVRPTPLPVLPPPGDLQRRMQGVFEDAYNSAVAQGAQAERQRITDAAQRYRAEAEDYTNRAIPALEARDFTAALTYVQRAASAADKATALTRALDGTQ